MVNTFKMKRGIISLPTKLILVVSGGAAFTIFLINLIMLNSSIEEVRVTGGFHSVGLNVARKLTTRCLAYSAHSGTPQANLLDYEKLKEYEGKHEPCVYSFDYGWQAEIKTKDYGEWDKLETIKFGARALSVGDAIIQDRITKQSIPVTVVYPNNYRYSTTLYITVVSGDLELLAGKIDALCIANDEKDLIIKLDYKTKIENDKICIERSDCHELDCWACRDLRIGDYQYCGSNKLRVYDIFAPEDAPKEEKWKDSYLFQPDSYVISVRYNSTEDQIQLRPWLPI